MHRKITFITAFLFLISSTELHELARVPQLVMHFCHHQAMEPKLSVTSFLKLHYQANHPDDRDDNEDRQLPFKSGYDIVHIDVTTAIPREAETTVYIPENGKPKSFYPEGMPLHRAFSIFHPPRYS